jgi:hypothetical protein
MADSTSTHLHTTRVKQGTANTVLPIDRSHSRLLDVHRGSDHPEVRRIVKQIYSELSLNTISEIESKSNNKAKASGEVHLRVLLLDLYVAWKTDPTLAIGVSLGNGDYTVNSRYNALFISPKIRPVVHALNDLGYIDLIKHSHSTITPSSNTTSRIRASEKLGKIFISAKMNLSDVDLNTERECIVLKDADEAFQGYGFSKLGKPVKKKSKQIEYDDTSKTVKMRSDLTKYNKLLERTFIDIPALEEPFIVRKGAGSDLRIAIDQSGKFVRRIFSRGSWSMHGRFYGGWWQQIPSSDRQNIFINNRPTVEVDYSGLHIAILCAQKNIKIKGDKYDLGQALIDGVDVRIQRSWVKRLVLTAINAKSEKAAFTAFRSNSDKGSVEKSLTNKQLKTLLDAFKVKHPHLESDLCSDKGIELMYIDSQVTDHIIKEFTKMGEAVLTIHDSYIVDERYILDLRLAMSSATKSVLGADLETDLEGKGCASTFLTGTDDDTIYKQLESIMHLSRSCVEAYKVRHKQFQERKWMS